MYGFYLFILRQEKATQLAQSLFCLHLFLPPSLGLKINTFTYMSRTPKHLQMYSSLERFFNKWQLIPASILPCWYVCSGYNFKRLFNVLSPSTYRRMSYPSVPWVDRLPSNYLTRRQSCPQSCITDLGELCEPLITIISCT